jgi:hypothetical protein
MCFGSQIIMYKVALYTIVAEVAKAEATRWSLIWAKHKLKSNFWRESQNSKPILDALLAPELNANWQIHHILAEARELALDCVHCSFNWVYTL